MSAAIRYATSSGRRKKQNEKRIGNNETPAFPVFPPSIPILLPAFLSLISKQLSFSKSHLPVVLRGFVQTHAAHPHDYSPQRRVSAVTARTSIIVSKRNGYDPQGYHLCCSCTFMHVSMLRLVFSAVLRQSYIYIYTSLSLFNYGTVQ